MSFEYLDHISDVCIRASGDTLEEAFCEAARAMFSLMADLDRVRPQHTVDVSVSARTSELLLVEWLSRLLSEADLRGVIFSRFSAVVEEDGEFTLKGTARGEPLDVLRHRPEGGEVKGVTYSGLHVLQEGGRFTVQCVLDV